MQARPATQERQPVYDFVPPRGKDAKADLPGVVSPISATPAVMQARPPTPRPTRSHRS